MSIVEESQVRRITCDEFMRMFEAGVFAEGDRLELLDGFIIEMSSQSPKHSLAVARMTSYFSGLLRKGRLVLVQQPILADPYSLPEPDFAVVDEDAFEQGHPPAARTLLLVEISLSSVEIDRRKASLYARAGAPEYWLVDLEQRKVEVHVDPTERGYGRVTILDERHELAPGFAPGSPVLLSSLLPNG